MPAVEKLSTLRLPFQPAISDVSATLLGDVTFDRQSGATSPSMGIVREE
jgi:hypothetical protein